MNYVTPILERNAARFNLGRGQYRPGVQLKYIRKYNTKRCNYYNQVIKSHHRHTKSLGFVNTTSNDVKHYCTQIPGGHNKQIDPSNVALDHSESNIDPLLKTVTMSEVKDTGCSNVIPGKGPPPEPPVDCCMSGCANCVWIQYADELKEYYTDGMGSEKALQAIESIENPSLKAFLKLELSLR